ncbi:MAG: lipid-binding SYLF domain-containing protein [Deltaproteobacteria bacterium]|nr:lipid-binding SYLF domain-containing protein [Deltaproteobacteria bacterium]
MKTRFSILLPVIVLSLVAAASQSFAAAKEAARVETATDVMEKIMGIPEKAIPPALLSNAHGIAIVPGVIKVGFILGGQYGTGVLVVRDKNGGWSNPVFVKLMSGSVGWQIGAESTDFVLVFKTPKSVEGIMKGKFTFGADASIAAGPVGRRGKAETDVELKAEIYSYSRSRGLFAGISLEGSSMQIDHDADAAFYGKKDVLPREIVEGAGIETPPAAARLKNALGKHAPAGGK